MREKPEGIQKAALASGQQLVHGPVTGCYTSEEGRGQQYYSRNGLKIGEMQFHPFSFETGWQLVNIKYVLADLHTQEHYSCRVHCRKSASPVCYHRKATK